MQTFARQLTIQSGKTCAPLLTVEDALGVGHSIRALLRTHKLPPGTHEAYERVAHQILSAARIAVVEGQ